MLSEKSDLDRLADNILLFFAEQEKNGRGYSAHLFNLGWGHESLDNFWASQARTAIKALIAEYLFGKLRIEVNAR